MVNEVTPDELKEKMDSDEDTQVIDIRESNEFKGGHIQGSLNVPMSELTLRLGEIEWGDDIVVVCPVGQSSVQAARLIQSYEEVDDDAEIASMKGGLVEWEYDLETE